MAFSRGRFGLEYDARRRNDGDRPLLKGALIVIAVLSALSLVLVYGRKAEKRIAAVVPHPPSLAPDAASDLRPPLAPPRTSPSEPGAAASRTNGAAPAAKPASPPPPQPLSAAARLAQRWLNDSADRLPEDRNLLERLLAAERAGDARLARDALERLRQRPSMADLDEPLARRLGALNRDWLFSARPTPWTILVTTRPGDSYHRIAREHGATLAAVLALNHIADPAEKPTAGRRLRVPNFPRAALVVHRQTKQADVSLNGKFFRRYYASTGAATKVGAYPITREVGPRMRLKELGIVFAPQDLDEIAMLLPPGASLAVANP